MVGHDCGAPSTTVHHAVVAGALSISTATMTVSKFETGPFNRPLSAHASSHAGFLGLSANRVHGRRERGLMMA